MDKQISLFILVVFGSLATVLSASINNGSNLHRFKRQRDFFFPDDSSLNTIPNGNINNNNNNNNNNNVPTRPRPTVPPTPRQPNPSASSIAPPNPATTSSPRSPGSTPGGSVTTASPIGQRTTATPDFLRCMANCPTTSEYNPICATDRELYYNEQKLRCAQRCGSTAQMIRRGNCDGVF